MRAPGRCTFPAICAGAMPCVKGMAPYAAVAMDEVDRVGRRLKARAALASEASGQRGNSIVHSASEDARERAVDTRPEPGSSARAALASEASGQRGDSIVRAPDTRPEPGSSARAAEADLDAVWCEEWAAMADRVAAVADKAAAEGREITAGNHYMRAGNYYYSAERFIPPGAEKLAMYRKALRAYHAATEPRHPQIGLVG